MADVVFVIAGFLILILFASVGGMALQMQYANSYANATDVPTQTALNSTNIILKETQKIPGFLSYLMIPIAAISVLYFLARAG